MSNLHLRLVGMSGRLYSLLRQKNVLTSPILHSGCRLQCTSSDLNNGEENHEQELNQPATHRQVRKLTKLHNRTLTEEELEYEKKQYKRFSSLEESDTFGNLRKIQNRKVETEELYKFGRLGRPESSKYNLNSSTEKTRLADGSFNIHLSRSSQLDGSLKRRRRNRGDFDKFGSLSEADTDVGLESVSTEIGSHNERFPDDEDDESEHHIRLSAYNRRHTQAWYGRQIEKLGKSGKIKEAIAVLEDWMLKRDRVLPNQYNFTVLIGVLGRVGYTKKAFQLFNKMKKMGLQPEDPTYTALFNACANSPWRKDGLTRANNLRNLMQIKGYEPNLTTYQSLLKVISASHLHPDMQTFACLAMTCRNRWDGMQLLKDMEQCGLSPNIEVLGTLAYASNLDFGYKLSVLQHVEGLDLCPNDKFIEVIERSIAIAKQKIVQVERGMAVNDFISSDYFSTNFAKFMTHYKTWLHRTRPQERMHPWEDFRTKKDEQAEARR